MATSKSAKNAATSATKSLLTGVGNIKAKKTLQKVILGWSWTPLGEGFGKVLGEFFQSFFAFLSKMSTLQKHAPDPLKLCREAHTDKHGDQQKCEKRRNVGHEIAANRGW